MPGQDYYIGMISMFAGNYAPEGWLLCNGQTLNISDNPALFSILGTKYGGDGMIKFALPDLRNRYPLGAEKKHEGISGGHYSFKIRTNNLPKHKHQLNALNHSSTEASTLAEGAMLASAYIKSGSKDISPSSELNNIYTDSTGNDATFSEHAISQTDLGGKAVKVQPPHTKINFCICVDGEYPPRKKNDMNSSPSKDQIPPLEPQNEYNFAIGSIMLFAGSYTPEGWYDCDGQFLNMADHESLFSIVSHYYSHGISSDNHTFKLPDLRNRFPISVDNKRYHLGEYVGSEHFRIPSQAMPSHNHLLYAQTSKATESKGTENMLASAKNIEIKIGEEFKTCSIPYYSKKNESFDLVPMGSSMIQTAGQNKAIKHMPPYLGLRYIICDKGYYPPRP